MKDNLSYIEKYLKSSAKVQSVSRCEVSSKIQAEELEGTISTYEDFLNTTEKFKLPLQSTINTHSLSTTRPRRRPQVPVHDNIEQTEAELMLNLEDENEEISLKWCAFCQKETTSVKTFRNSSKTFWASMGILMSGGFLGCFLLPYASDHCKQPEIVCTKCSHILS